MPRASTFITKPNLPRASAELLSALPPAGIGKNILKALAASAMGHWKSQAKKQLRSTARDYIAGLSMEEGTDVVMIHLDDALPNLVEQGFKGGNMREWMLNSPKAKHGKNGKYLIIPFRHGTPDTGGENVGNAMPTDIYAAAKKLAPTLSRPSRAGRTGPTTKWGERLTASSPHANAAARTQLQTLTKPWHSASIYTGMIRKQKTYKKAQSSYSTFRVISERVDRSRKILGIKRKEHWFHPGIKRHDFAGDTRKHVKKIAAFILKSTMGS